MRHYFAFALLVLLFSAPFANFVQPLVVKAHGLDGLPAEGAEVEILFQNSSGLSDTDGKINGRIGFEGRFSANLSNIVPLPYENRAYTVRLSAPYWSGMKRQMQATGEGEQTITFEVPYELTQVQIEVVDTSGQPLLGAEVALPEMKLLKTTGIDGKASFFLPKDRDFAGFASIGEKTAQFTVAAGAESSTATLDLGNGSSEGKPMPFFVTLIGRNGLPLAQKQVEFVLEGGRIAAKTDANGTAAATLPFGSEVAAVFTHEETPFSYNFTVGGGNQTIKLPNQLVIRAFEALVVSPNCYRVAADVYDPRLSLPIEVDFRFVNQTSEETLVPPLSDDGIFALEKCVGEETLAKAIARNKYEFAETEYALMRFDANATGVQGPDENQGVSFLDVGLWIVLLAVLVAIVLVATYTKSHFARPVRFILEYIRLLMRIANIKRKKGKKEEEN